MKTFLSKIKIENYLMGKVLTSLPTLSGLRLGGSGEIRSDLVVFQ